MNLLKKVIDTLNEQINSLIENTKKEKNFTKRMEMIGKLQRKRKEKKKLFKNEITKENIIKN